MTSCATNLQDPLGRFLHQFPSLTLSLLHNTKVGADQCTVDVSTGCVIVSLEPHASEPFELCVLSVQVPSIPSIPSWTCLSISSLLTASFLKSTQLEPKPHRDLVQNHTCSSTSRVLDHAAFVLVHVSEDGQFHPLRHITRQRMTHDSQAII